MGQQEVLGLFDEWNNALGTGEPEKVAALYDTDAILLPTISNQVRDNHDTKVDYFTNFLKKGPVGKIDESNVRVFDDLAINSGIYTFTFNDGSVVPARYTFVYRRTGGSWKIVEHHSSMMPE